MKLKKFLTSVLCATMILTLSSCGKTTVGSSVDKGKYTSSSSQKITPDISYDDQLEPPKDGEDIVVMETTMGTMKIRLFPNEAPKTVENFVGLVKQGYYNGIIFHRVINNFMIQGGDPTGTGQGGESLWGGKFEDEFSTSRLNLRGSLAMANSGKDTNGSQFFINQKPDVQANSWSSLESDYEKVKNITPSERQSKLNGNYAVLNTDLINSDYKKIYEKQGGNPSLDGAYNALDPQRGHTVFGQVFEGLAVVDKIATVKTDSSTDKPIEDVKIISATVEQYKN